MADNNADRPLTIAAFNVQKFGPSKCGNNEVMGFLTDIVRRYDIILIQEIVDKTERTIPRLVKRVNTSNENGHVYYFAISERLGTGCRDGRGQEQYAYLYRRGVVNVVKEYQDRDRRFKRPPYSVKFRIAGGNKDFFLLGSHVQPGRDNVQWELEGLRTTAFPRAAEAFGTNRGVIMGDLNAGGSYLSRKQHDSMVRYWRRHFTWLLGYDADTTVNARRRCAYDRFIVHKTLTDLVVPGSAAVFNFTEEYRLTQEQAESVSNHFPIEFQLNLGAAQA